MSVRFVVPGQPVGKGRPRIGKVGNHARMFTPAKTVSYEGLIAHEASQAMAGRDLFEGPCDVRMVIECMVPASWSQKKQRQALAGDIRPTTKPDVDNIVKAIFDGINGVVWKDDVQVCELGLTKRYSTTPCVAVMVIPIKPSGIVDQGGLL